MSGPERDSTSVWAGLKERHQQVLEDRDPLYLDDPVHPGVVFRYRYVPIAETAAPQKRLSKIKDPGAFTLASACETILLAVEEIMIVDPAGTIPTGVGGRKLYEQPLSPLSDDGVPLRFDERLVKQMEWEKDTASSARKIVLAWFARKEYVVIEHAQEISAWFVEVSDEVREDFAGALGKA